MNKELELEAEKYFKEAKTEFGSEALKTLACKDFIAGAQSKWVERQKLEFAVEQLSIVSKRYGYGNNVIIDKQIEELEQKLSEL